MMMKYVRPLLTSLVFLCIATNLAAKSEAKDAGYYTTKNKEYYLTDAQIAFIRPGLDVEILDIVIPDDFLPLVTFSLKDPGGMPLDINGVSTPGPVDMRFMLAFIPQGEEQKVNYHGDSFRDRDGAYESLGDGVYTYKFTTLLPDTYEVDATHTLGAVGRRDLREFELERYVDNEVYNFVPSGIGDPVPRDIVTTETCNGRCHDPLAMHGSRYTEVGICTQCHNPGHRSGPHRSFNVLIHQKHREVEEETGFPAPLNTCETCHTGGIPTENFPLVANPNPIPVCDMSLRGATELTWDFPEVMEIRVGAPDGPPIVRATGSGSKETTKWLRDGTEFYVIDDATGNTVQKLPVDITVLGCVSNAPGTFRGTPGAQHTNWLDHPSRLVCGACHNDVDFETGEGHSEFNFPVFNDDVCTDCHEPSSGEEFDRSIPGAHKPLFKSTQFPGVLVEIIDVTDTDPGDMPTVTFSLGSKNGPLDPAELDRLRFSIVGPNEDFGPFFVQETVGELAAAIKDGEYWTYTFTTPLPADAEGSYTAGFEGRDIVAIDLGDEVSDERDNAENTTFAFAVTDDVAIPRRMVVDDVKCENCHFNRDKHGGARHNPQYCVTCHRPDFLSNGEPPSTIHFKYMIHKIHRGEDLENGYVVNRSRGRVVDFSNIAFPGDLRNCESCHVNDSYLLPPPDGLLPTMTPLELWDPMQPIAAACLACHDSEATAAHAFTNTSFFGEACSNCHGQGKFFAVERVHAR